MNLFYHPHINPIDTQVVFEKEESRHISTVLRNKPGDLLYITNGTGHIFTVQLLSVSPKQSLATVIASKKVAPIPYQLHMAVAPTKNNDRFEWFLEKATEIGIHTITPIFCDRSERKIIKPERFERIIESAMKQSLKAYKPKLAPAVTFSEFIEQSEHNGWKKCIAHCDDTPRKLLKSVVDPRQNILILIGPEGDFTPKEIELATTNHMIEVSLGESRLRTETAAIVACHSVAMINS